MTRTYQELSKNEKQELLTYTIYNQGYLILFTWLFIMYLMFCIFLFYVLVFRIQSQFFTAILGIMFIQVAFIWFVKKIKKQNMLIFGYSSCVEHFFGLNKKDLRVGLKETIRIGKKNRK